MSLPVVTALELVQQYGSRDPFYIAEREGIIILNLDLPDNVSGVAVYCYQNRYILLNESLIDPLHRRMVAAHELGHIRLHPYDSWFYMDNHPLQNARIGKNERQANTFAAYLLIDPAHINEGDTRDMIAFKLGVPLSLLDYYEHPVLKI